MVVRFWYMLLKHKYLQHYQLSAVIKPEQIFADEIKIVSVCFIRG